MLWPIPIAITAIVGLIAATAPPTPDSWGAWVLQGGSTAILLAVAYGFVTGKIVSGKHHDRVLAERDRALDLVLRQVGVADRAVDLSAQRLGVESRLLELFNAQKQSKGDGEWSGPRDDADGPA